MQIAETLNELAGASNKARRLALDSRRVAGTRCELDIAFHGGRSVDITGAATSGPATLERFVVADVLDAWFDPAPEVLEALQRDISAQARYSPPAHPVQLVSKLGNARQLNAENIIPAGGSSALMYAMLPQLCARGDKALLIRPSYSEYPHLLGSVLGCKIEYVNVSDENDFCIDFNGIDGAVGEKKPKICVIVNPNNPTGAILPPCNIYELARSHPSTIFWVDEAYVDYSEQNITSEPFVNKLSNLIVLKSMSKVYSLSGLRVAYLVAPIDLTKSLGRFLPPWPISWPAYVAAMAAIDCNSYYQTMYAETRKLRQLLAQGLESTSLVEQIIPSQGNFLLAALASGVSALTFANALTSDGIFIRSFPNMDENFAQRFVRISVRSGTENHRLIAAFSAAGLT